MYAVVDLETTGLRPSWNDRVVEVAVVCVDDSGQIGQEWCTLVNPQRDLGPQSIHGILAAEVLDAPTFADIAGQLARLLAGRVVVAHNLRFDAPFLQAEYERLGITVPVEPDRGLCTMSLAGRYLPGAGRGLADCCARAGVTLTHAHSALHDARAAAGLLTHFLQKAGQPPHWTSLCTDAAGARWPELPSPAVRPVRRRTAGQDPEHFLARLVTQLPRAASADADAYLELLDQALLDRHISATEQRGLVEFAGRVGLSRDQVVELHDRYLRALVAAALADGVVTDAERSDLEQVTSMLGLSAAHLEKALSDPPTDPPAPLSRFALAPGDAVVFTGQFEEPREVWEDRATAAGLVPRPSVTKRTRLVVAADPDSLSGKARKARDYRIPIVDPTTFLGFLPEAVDR